VAASSDGDDQTSQPDTGRVFIISGAGTRDVLRVIDSPDAGARFGQSIAVADLDGDGLLDYVIGAPLANAGHGRVFFYSGASTGPRAAARLDTPLVSGSNERFGQAVAIVGDWGLPCGAADALPDVAVSSPGADGAVSFYSGIGVMAGTAPAEYFRRFVTNAPSGEHYGWSLAAADLDTSTSGLELVVGAPQSEKVLSLSNTSSVGPGYIEILGRATCGSTTPTVIQSPRKRVDGAGGTGIPTFPTGSGFGASVAVPGNINGLFPVASDIVVGAPFDSTGGTNQGSIGVYYEPLMTNSGVRVTSPAAGGSGLGALFGFAVSGAGFVYDCTAPIDFMVGSPGTDPQGITDRGSVYLYHFNQTTAQIESTMQIDGPQSPFSNGSKGYFGTTLSGPAVFDPGSCLSESLIGSPGLALTDSTGFRLDGPPNVFGISRQFPAAGRAWVFRYVAP
jgi:FG-GAP repeat protein